MAALPDLSRLPLCTPIGAPLQETDEYAHRSDEDHVSAMAVSAYSFQWDELLNARLQERDLGPLLRALFKWPVAYLDQFVDQFIFFAPMRTLHKVQADLAANRIRLQRVIHPDETQYIRLDVDGLEDAQVVTLRRDVREQIVEPMAEYGADRSVLHATLDFMLRALHRVTEEVGADSPFIGGSTLLYHGSVGSPSPPELVDGQDSERAQWTRVLNALSHEFVSTSRDVQVAENFARSGHHYQMLPTTPGGARFVFRVELEMHARFIDVDALLTSINWSQLPKEKEVLLAPGHRFIVQDEEEVQAPQEWNASPIWYPRVIAGIPYPGPWQPPPLPELYT